MSGPRRLRAFVLTGGRTHVAGELSMETMIVATDAPADPSHGPEHERILGICAEPQSLVDLSALLKMPLGVIRVLLGDLLASGHLETGHYVAVDSPAPTSQPDQPSPAPAPTPSVPVHRDLTLLGELLDGIEAL